jgi:hypothetical protein
MLKAICQMVFVALLTAALLIAGFVLGDMSASKQKEWPWHMGYQAGYERCLIDLHSEIGLSTQEIKLRQEGYRPQFKRPKKKPATKVLQVRWSNP